MWGNGRANRLYRWIGIPGILAPLAALALAWLAWHPHRERPRRPQTTEPRAEDPTSKALARRGNWNGARGLTIRTLAELRDLPPLLADAGIPVQTRARVTAVSPDGVLLQDESGAAYAAALPDQIADITPGKRVELWGRSEKGGFSPILKLERFQVLPGPLRWPRPEAAEGESLLRPGLDCRWVETNAILTAASPGVFGETVLMGQTRTRSLPIRVFGERRPPGGLIHATARVRGVRMTLFNSSRRMIGAELLVPDWSHLEVIRAGPESFGTLPLQPISRLFTNRQNEATWVRVRGTVTLSKPSGELFLEDAGAPLMVRMQEPARFVPGEVVEATGIPILHGFRPMVTSGRAVAAGSRGLVVPEEVHADRAQSGDVDSRLIQIDARLTGIESSGSRAEFQLIDDGRIFSAVLENAPPDLGSRLRPGARVRLRGVCVTQWDTLNLKPDPQSFAVWLRDPSDVEVLQGPAGLAAQTFAPILAGAGLVALFALAWAWTLRRQVHLQTADLRRHRAEAETASRAKADFLATMSHEIRTPMNGVLGLLDLLKETTLNHEQRSYLAAASESAEALLTILNDVLDFSKIEAGKLRLSPQPMDLLQTCEEAVRLLAVKAAEKSVPVYLWFSAAAPAEVVADAGRVRQILMNLIGNAVKFTEQGFVAVEVEHRAREGYRISVHDTGIGIREADLGRLFEKFSQGDSSDRRRFEGTGLGLAISRQLAEGMGGTIAVCSQERAGSTFRVDLPLPVHADSRPDGPLRGRSVALLGGSALERAATWETAQRLGLEVREVGTVADARGSDFLVYHRVCRPEEPGSPMGWPESGPGRLIVIESVRAPSSGPAIARCVRLTRPVTVRELRRGLLWLLRQDTATESIANLQTVLTEPVGPPAPDSVRQVLLVEDNRVNQLVAARLLEKLECKVTLAANGQEAVRLAADSPFDLILMDCQMPLMDGYEATRRIRQHPGPNREAMIVALTAAVMERDRDRARAAGMDAHLAKPLRRGDLERLVGTLDPARAGPREPGGGADARGGLK